MRKRTAYTLGLALICFVVLMILTPSIPQSQDYHNFADQRTFFGIPNALDVISNFPFLIIGLIGLVLCHYGNYFKLSLQGELWGWTCFYVGVAAVAVGSSYYHLKPDDARLVWDRLPMTVAFTSIVAIFIIERIDERKGMISIIPLVLAGVISIAYWRFFDDLRPYALVQFVPIIAIPVMAILLPPMYTHSTYWLWAAGFYLLAKVLEATDDVVYKWTNHIVSGHTLKHLFAAMVPVFLTLMLAKRSEELERRSLYTIWKISWTKTNDGDSNVEGYAYSKVLVEEPQFFDDLRPYALVQFVPIIAIPVMAILLPPMYTHSTYWLWAAGFYLLAKVLEATDDIVYKWTNHIVSGHTLKHLFAAMVPVFLTLMLAKRSEEPERRSLYTIWKISWTKANDGDSNVESHAYSKVLVEEPQ